MKDTNVAAIIAHACARHGLIAQDQSRFMKVASPGEAIVYVLHPNKSRDVRRVELSGWAYGGLPKGLELPPAAYRHVVDNGAVSIAVDLDKAPDGWLARCLEALASIEREEDPRRTGRGRGTRGAAGPSLSALVAHHTAEIMKAVEEATEEEAEEDGPEAVFADA